MALVVVSNGESVALQLLVNKITTPENLVLRLYKSDTTPAEADTAGTYTEADFTGYAAITLTGASWTVSGTSPTQIAYAQQTFTSSAGSQNQAVYGYFMTRVTTGDLIYAERFTDGPYTIVNNGAQVQVTPILTAD